MKIYLAQIEPVGGNPDHNLDLHLRSISEAAARGADLVCFPELSLSGYEPRLAARMVEPDDSPRIFQLQRAVDKAGLAALVGVPVEQEGGVAIGMWILRPHQAPKRYAKQFLHVDEEPFFVPGKGQGHFSWKGWRIAPAICYEALQWPHAEAGQALGMDLYLASVAKSEKGMQKANLHLPEVARRFGIPVALVNSTGPCDNFVACGQSAVWDRNGNLVRQLDAGPGYLLSELE